MRAGSGKALFGLRNANLSGFAVALIIINWGILKRNTVILRARGGEALFGGGHTLGA